MKLSICWWSGVPRLRPACDSVVTTETVWQAVWASRVVMPGDSVARMASVMMEVGEWVVAFEWPADAIGSNAGGPSRMVIEPIGEMPVGGLSSTVLRQINFREAAERHREEQARQASARNRTRKDIAIFEKLREAERAELRRALSEDGVTDYYLAFLSWQYVQAVGAGQDKPVDNLAEDLGRSLNTVKSHLWQARKKGLLTGGSAGRKGGELSSAAEELLEPYAQAHLAEYDKLRKKT